VTTARVVIGENNLVSLEVWRVWRVLLSPPGQTFFVEG
jgi:hypothetical protein